MGGDGGVIASNRKYMRGAGTADHTADTARGGNDKDVTLEKEELMRQMKTCAVSGQPIVYGGKQPIVVCPFGRLYHKEAVVQALLERKQHDDARIRHIRGLKDLHEARFHVVDEKPSCPITGLELNGLVPAYVLVPGSTNSDAPPNVVSERAIKEMGSDALDTEYGPVKEQIRLVPPTSSLKEIQEAWRAKLDKKNGKKKSKKKDKKRKREETTVMVPEESTVPKTIKTSSLTDEKKSDVFSSIFTKRDGKEVSEGEQKDDLFVR